MIRNSNPGEENIIEDIKNLFRLKKQVNYTAIKDIVDLFRRGKETKAIKDRILGGFKNIFEHEEENYYKLVRVNNFWSNNHIEYESKNKTPSVEEYINKVSPYLKGIINNLKISGMLKIQLTIANSFISSLNNDEEDVMHSKFDNL